MNAAKGINMGLEEVTMAEILKGPGTERLYLVSGTLELIVTTDPKSRDSTNSSGYVTVS